jgi:WD40 repeat protein
MDNHFFQEKSVNPKSIFFSYGHDDNQEIVERLKIDLEKRGHKVWLDISKIRTWDDWRGSIAQGIHDANMAIAFISFHSVRDPSVCRNEISMALQHFGRVYPVLVEDVPFANLPILLTTLQWPNLSDWKQKKANDPEGFGRFYLECLKDILQKIEGECSRLAEEVDLLKKVLEPVSFDAIFSQHLDGFVGRDWIFEEFNQWLSKSDSRVFWLKAGPGFGKSAVSVQMIKKRPEIFVANWFCDHQSTVLSDPLRALTTIAYQLSLKIENYRSNLLAQLELSRSSDLSKALDRRQQLSKLSLPELFRFLLAEPLARNIPLDHQYIVLIDALDEAQTANGNNPLASLISSRLSQLPSWIQFVLTSRPDEAVTRQLLKFNPQDIHPSDDRNQADLRQFARQELLTLPIFSDWDDDRKSHFIDKVVEKSGGMILYLRLLQEGYKENSHGPDDIDNIPSGLEGFYQQLFDRLFPEKHKFEGVSKLLGLLICALEPMTKEEIEEALEIEEEVLDKFLQQISQILIMNPREDDPQSLCLTLCHKSLFDWLIKGGNPYFISKKTAFQRMAAYCKNAIVKKTKSISTYARRHAVEHLVAIEDFQAVESVLCNLDFIEERLRFDELRDLLADFSLVQTCLPENIERQEELKSRNEELHLWVSGQKSELIPQSVYLWSESQIEDFRQSINQDDLKIRIDDFCNFVATQAKFLERYSDSPGFVIQQAFNYAPSGPVHQTAQQALSNFKKPLLLREWTAKDQFNPCDPCIHVLELENDVQNSSFAVDWCQHVLAGRRDYSVVLMDLQSGAVLRTLKEHRNQVVSAAFSAEGDTFATGSKGSLCIWDTQSGVLIQNFNQYPDWINIIASMSSTQWVSGGKDGSLCWWNSEPDAHEPCIQINAHETSIPALACAHGGNVVVSGSIDGVIKVWSRTGEFLKTLQFEDSLLSGPVHSISLRHDGKTCLVGHHNGHISFWDVPSGKCLNILKGHEQRVYGVSMTPDGKIAASSSMDKTVRIWKLENGTCARILNGHTFPVDGISISPWGDEVLSSGKDGRMIRWAIEKRSCLVSNLVTREEVTSLKELADGRIISGHKEGKICIRDQNSLATSHSWRGHQSDVWDMDIWGDDLYLMSAGFDGDLKIWHIDKQREIHSENFGKLYVSTISKPSSTLIIAGANKQINYLSLEQLKLEQSTRLNEPVCKIAKTIPKAHRSNIRSAVCSNDGKIIYSGAEDKLVKAWSAQTCELVHEFSGHEDFVYTVALSPDGMRLASAGKDRAIRIWNLETNTCEKILQGHDRAITEVWYSKDGRRLCSISWDNTFRVWDLRSGKNTLIHAFTGLSQAIISIDRKKVILGSAIGEVIRFNPHCIFEGF